MKDQKGQEAKKAKDQLKDIHNPHLLSLYESISEANQLFKDAEYAKEVCKRSKQMLSEYKQKKWDAKEVLFMEENSIECEMHQQTSEQIWLAFKKKQINQIDELKKQMKLERTITQAEKKEETNIAKKKKQQKSLTGSPQNSIAQVKSNMNIDEQTKAINEEKREIKKIQINEKEEEEDKKNTGSNINSISEYALNASTATNSPQKPSNNSNTKEENAPQSNEIEDLKHMIEKQYKQWNRRDAEYQLRDAEYQLRDAKQRKENEHLKSLNAQCNVEIRCQAKQTNELTRRVEKLERILFNYEKIIIKSSLAELLFKKISWDQFKMSWKDFKSSLREGTNKMQLFQKRAQASLKIKSADWDIIVAQKDKRNAHMHKTLNEVFQARAIILDDKEEPAAERQLFSDCLSFLMDVKQN